MIYQGTCVILKSELIERNLIGRVIQRFEDASLKIASAKMVQVTNDLAFRHYLKDKKWFEGVGKKVIRQFEKYRFSVVKHLGSTDPVRIGEKIYYWSMDDLANKQAMALIIEGPHAIERVKQIVGETEPLEAGRGTIRGDWCTDSIIYSNTNRRAIHNLIHRSSNMAEAKREIDLWFN